jgi:2-iminobutanoate/2-iminopropanoate deaminase
MRKIILFASLVLIVSAVAWIAWAQKPTSTSAPPYSPTRQAGHTLYISGQIARTPTGQEVRGSIEAETQQVLENLGRILKANNCGFDDVVNATVYLADINDYAAMNKVYATFFTNGFPARACIGGASLVFGFKVEISAIAYKP